MPAPSLDGTAKSGRSGEGGRGGRKKYFPVLDFFFELSDCMLIPEMVPSNQKWIGKDKSRKQVVCYKERKKQR